MPAAGAERGGGAGAADPRRRAADDPDPDRAPAPSAATLPPGLFRIDVPLAQGLLGIDAGELPENAVSLLGRASSLTRGTARWARAMSRWSIVALVVWALALGLLGWLDSVWGLLLLALVAVAWLVAWLAARNLAATLSTVADGFEDVSREVATYQATGAGMAGLPDEAVKLLRSAVDRDRLSLGQLRKLHAALRDVRSTVSAARTFNLATYTTGLLSYVGLAALLATGLLTLLVAVVSLAV